MLKRYFNYIGKGQCLVRVFYNKGYGVSQDNEEAMKWFQKVENKDK